MDVDNTANCPTGQPCQRCGAADSHRVTVECRYGVYCLPICDSCQQAGKVRNSGAVTAVLDHCDHVGLTIDENRRQAGLAPLLENKYPGL